MFFEEKSAVYTARVGFVVEQSRRESVYFCQPSYEDRIIYADFFFFSRVL